MSHLRRDPPDDPSHIAPSLLIVSTVAATIQAFLIPYARRLRADGWRVEAAARGATEEPLLRDAFDAVHELPLSRSLKDVGGIRRGQKAMSTLLRGGYDIVHVHTPIAGFVTRFSASRIPSADRPAMVYTAHGFHFHRDGDVITNTVFATAERVAGRWTDRLIVINHEDRAAARRWRIVPDRKLVEMPGIGVDTAWFAPANAAEANSSEPIARLAITPGAPVFVLIGEFSRRKRPVDVVHALASMRHKNAHLVLLGDGPTRQHVESAIESVGIADRIHVVGVVADVRPYIAAATALVLASDREGLPRSIMEALSMGVPVVSSSARGNPQLVLPDAGFVVPTGDVRALASAMDRMADDPDGARVMGARGRARMVDQYAEPILIELHERMYAQILAERGRLQGPPATRRRV